LLAVVNGGSDSVSVFAVSPSGGLRLIDVANSGGVDPISVAVRGSSIYVLNAGNGTTPPNVAGFNLFGRSFLQQPVATQNLNPGASSPEQIGISPNGRDLVVTEQTSNTIDVFPLDLFGMPGAPVTTTIPGNVGPYGFAFTPTGVLTLSEAATGALATFAINPSGALQAISTVPDGQQAPCWVVLTAGGSEAFTSNAHSGNVSAYTVARDGTLSLLPPAAQTSPGAGDTDLAIGGSTLYIGDDPNVDASTISPAGLLGPSTTAASGLPAGTFGLAATSTPAIGFGDGDS
ncbi:MAG: beta-propeller fold lactonase family protein, partial [Acidimicrobiaceae bacterium]|nr:beta-propeller fold lactonase family protein [Acidimicrobiaceae bacterium]